MVSRLPLLGCGIYGSVSLIQKQIVLGPKMMESDPLSAPSQSHLLSKNVFRHAHMFLVGCCVHHRKLVAIKGQVYFINIIFWLAQSDDKP